MNLRRNRSYLIKNNRVLASASTFNKVRFFDKGNTPFCIVKGEGPYTWDVDGNKYIDYIIGLGTMTLGHNHPEVNEAIISQLKNGISFSLPSSLEIEVAEMLVSRIPSAEKIKFGKNGNDVTSAAVRLARYYTRRDHILFCGYHGWQDWYVSQTTKNGGIPNCIKGLSHRFVYNDVDSMHKLIKRYKNNVACIILEPITAREYPKNNFLEKVRDIATSNKIVLIFDEIVTGFRFHKNGAQGLFKVTPDLSCFSKAIANGMPLSVLVGKNEFMAKFDDIYFSLTNAGETLSLAAAKAVLQFYDKVDVPGHLAKIGRLLKDGMERLISIHGLSDRMKIIGHDCRFGIDLMYETDPQYDQWDDLLSWTELVSYYGILSGGWHMISYAHTPDVIKQTLRIYNKVLPEMKERIVLKKIR